MKSIFLFEKVDKDRLKKLIYDFIKIPSPTGNERAFAEYFAKCLLNIGLDVQVDYEFPNSPSVIGWLSKENSSKFPVLQFDGHLDHVNIHHVPPYIDGNKIYGRGVADMKSNLAALVEALRILKISNFLNKKGRILITAHGLHEPPEGNSAPLISLIKKGIYGNSCIVAECAEDFLAIEGRGLAFFEFEIIGKEKNIHEITANFLLKENLINPLFVGFELLKLLFKQDNKIKTGSLFISIFHCGDEPNRFPNYCKIGGTRRYLPTEDFKLVYNEFEEIAKMLNQIFYPKVEIRFKVINRRESFHVSKDSKIVASLQKAYYKVTGTKLKEKMLNIVADAPYFANVAHIPVTYHGVDSRTAHSDLEFINIDDAVRASKVYIQTAIEFFTKN